MNLINILLTVLGSCILEPVPENKSRVTGTRVRSGSLIQYLPYFETEIYRVMPWLLEKFEENTVSIFVHVQVQ